MRNTQQVSENSVSRPVPVMNTHGRESLMLKVRARISGSTTATSFLREVFNIT